MINRRVAHPGDNDPMTDEPGIVVDGSALTTAEVEQAAGHRALIAVDAAVWERVRRAHEQARAASGVRPVYGRTTGVGANRDVVIGAEDVVIEPGTSPHDLRLLLSHAAGVGDRLDRRTTRRKRRPKRTAQQ